MKFTGALRQPIVIRTRTLGLLTSTPEATEEAEKHNRDEFLRALTEQLSKLDELRNFLGLEEKSDNPTVNFALLALRLAERFVPGFRIKNVTLQRGKGRKKQWDTNRYSELLADYELLQSEKSRPDSEACRILATTSRFKARWGKYSPRSLRNKLIHARQEDKNMTYKIRNHLVSSGNFTDAFFTEMLINVYSITNNQK